MWMNNENRAFIPLWFLRNKDVEGKYKEGTDVSIPLWFSRNAGITVSAAGENSFHTTMVLTQRSQSGRCQMVFVLFPYHYGSHATSSRIVRCHEGCGMFPYHYGSHATMRRLCDNPNCKNGFHTTMVLTQQFRVCKRFLPEEDVSIPLWFSRNDLTFSGQGAIINRFHTTMVLTQRKAAVESTQRVNMFPYHYGSHATIQYADCKI